MKKILFGLFLFCLFAFGSQAHASVLSDALAQIKNLENEIAQLKANLTAWGYVPRTTTTTTANTNTNLKTSTVITQCSDGVDNDGDGLVDARDPGCHTDEIASNVASYNPKINNEGTVTISLLPQCSDGVDNDGDGLVDARDPGCHTDEIASNVTSYNPKWTFESTIPNGCTTTTKYSVTTGQLCTGVTYPPGCTSIYGYSVTTGQSCSPIAIAAAD